MGTILWATCLILLLLGGWLLTVIGLPGNWLMVAAAAAYAFLRREAPTAHFGWGVVGLTAFLALLGEFLEFLAGAFGAVSTGGSRRSAVLALVGSLAGGLIGIFFGLPIPVVGSILGAVVFAATGAFVGAFLGEQWKGRGLDASLQVGGGAMLGRLAGSVAKIAAGSAIVALVLLSLFW